MKSDRIVTVLAPFMGPVWVVIGAVFVLSAVVDHENRVVFAVAGGFAALAGIAFLAVKPATPAAVTRFQDVAGRLIGKR
ncbi:MAG TPA: hypothetical protein VGM84_10240 [Steroidobacteraceae bacterium]